MSSQEIEARAKTMGWMPKDKFVEEGQSESNWMEAEDYVKRGESIMPILKANNRKLAERLTAAETANSKLAEQLTAASESIEELKNFRSTVTKEKVKEQKTEIMSAIVKAREDGNVEAEVELTDKLSEVNSAIKEAEKPVAKKPDAPGPQLTDAAKSWMKDNPWFSQDKRKTAVAMGIADEWKAEGKPLGTKEFFDHVDSEIATMFDRNAERRERGSKVEGGGGGSGEGGGGSGSPSGRTYADLPAEARAACDKSAARLVGKGRAYASKAEWQKVYCEQFDWS